MSRKAFGEMIVDEKRIHSAFGYIQTDAEVAAFLTIPAVFKREIVVGRHEEHKGRDYKENVKENAFLYINKEKATALSVVTSTQWLVDLKDYDFDAIIRKTGEDVKGKTENNLAEKAGVRHSLNEEFSEELYDWIKNTPEAKRLTDGGYFRIGTTSDALRSIGVRSANIYWRRQKIADIMDQHQEMDASVVETVPNILDNPIIVMKSRTREDSIVLFGNVRAKNGNPVMAAVELTPTPAGRMEADFSLLTSAYGRTESNARKLIENSEILYLSENKERADTWMMSLGVQFPSDQTVYGSMGSISYQDGKVKITGKNYPELVGNCRTEAAGR